VQKVGMKLCLKSDKVLPADVEVFQDKDFIFLKTTNHCRVSMFCTTSLINIQVIDNEIGASG
jgi:hypothetical protein